MDVLEVSFETKIVLDDGETQKDFTWCRRFWRHFKREPSWLHDCITLWKFDFPHGDHSSVEEIRSWFRSWQAWVFIVAIDNEGRHFFNTVGFIDQVKSLVENWIQIIFNRDCALGNVRVCDHNEWIRYSIRIGSRQITALVDVDTCFKITGAFGNASTPDTFWPVIRTILCHIVDRNANAQKSGHVGLRNRTDSWVW